MLNSSDPERGLRLKTYYKIKTSVTSKSKMKLGKNSGNPFKSHRELIPRVDHIDHGSPVASKLIMTSEVRNLGSV